MRYLFAILLLSSSLFCNDVFAQTDSSAVIYDTVVVKEAPVIIQKTVYIPDTSKTMVSKKWILGINLAKQVFQNQAGNDYKLAFDNFYSPQMYVGKAFGKTILTLGLSYKSINANYLYNGSYNLQGKRLVSIIDTIDVYYKNVNGVITPQYVTETKNINEYYTFKRDTIFSGNLTAKYIDLPLQIGYQFQYKNIVLLPNIGLTTSLLINNATLLAQNNKTSFNKTYLSANAGFKVGYSISNTFILGIKGEINKNITNVLNTDIVNFYTQSYSADIQYLF